MKKNSFINVVREAGLPEGARGPSREMQILRAELLGERIVRILSTGQTIHFDDPDVNGCFKTYKTLYEPIGEDGTERVTYFMSDLVEGWDK